MSQIRKTKSMFDNIAESYYSLVPAFPERYIDLIIENFLIQRDDSIIDLGCGSGEFALKMAKHSPFVQGIDVSRKMISMAQSKDKRNKVAWREESADDFDFGENTHQLIFAFESFHLFSNQEQISRECAKGLKQGGALCIGWATYEWESLLRDAIVEIFASYGVPWGDWGDWGCPTFPALLEKLNGSLSSPVQKSISIETSTPTTDIINYLFSISKTAFLNRALRLEISQELSRRFRQIIPSGKSEGKTYYNIMYSINNPVVESLPAAPYVNLQA